MIDCYHSDDTQFEKNIEKELKISLTFFWSVEGQYKKDLCDFWIFLLLSLSLSLLSLSEKMECPSVRQHHLFNKPFFKSI